jgi:sulfonate transport system substrate-binding protein
MKMNRKGWAHWLVSLSLLLGLGPVTLAQAQSVGAALPSEVRIGTQKGASVLVLARKKQVIENRLKALGIPSVKWVEFQFGPPLLEALGAGAVDLGSVGDTPPVFAQAGGIDLVYAAANPSAEHAVLVPPGSSVKTLADLKGKRVAFGKGSSAQNVTIKALALVGLTLKDVEPIYLAPADATAAFNGGKIDAWVVWDPYYAIAVQNYGARVIADTSDTRLASSAYYVARREFAQKHPLVLSAVLEELEGITVWSGKNRSELAEISAEATGIDVKAWSTAYARGHFSLEPVSLANIAQQQALADSFYSLGVIPRKLNVADIAWTWPKPKTGSKVAAARSTN